MRKKRELTWQEKVYGVIVIILIIWMIINAMVNGRVTDEAVLNGAVFLLEVNHDHNGSPHMHPR